MKLLVPPLILLVITCSSRARAAKQPDGPVVLWNEKCPPAYAERPEEGKQLKKEIPEYHRQFRSQFQWQGGRKIAEPNDLLRKEIALTKKILSEVFQPGIVPLDSIGEKFRLVPNVQLKERKVGALVVRFGTDEYTMKITKTMGKKGKMFVTVRSTSGKPFDIQGLAKSIFNERIWPAKWEKPLFSPKLKRKSIILIGGAWMPRDTTTIDSSGNIIEGDAHLPVEDGPIGEGLYKRVDFYTNGRFAMFQILGGPKGGRRVESKAK